MNARSAAIALATLLIASPLALAGDLSFTARSLAIAGEGTIAGQAGALFLVLGPEGIAWDAQADAAKIERKWTSFVTVDPPVGVAPRNTIYDGQNEQRASVDYVDATLSGTGWRERGALLVLVPGDSFDVRATTGDLAIATAIDPRLEQKAPDVDNAPDDAAPDYLIRERIDGTFVDIVASGAEVEIRGNLVVRMLDVDYSVTSGGSATEYRTGEVSERDAVVGSTGRIETSTLTLTNAILRVRTTGSAQLLATQPAVTFSGALSAAEPQGLLDLPALRSVAPGRWDGTATLDLIPADGGIGVVAPVAVAAANAPAPRVVPLALVAGAGIAALVLLVGGALALRSRRARGDDIELALLAMEERRWDDALPHLERLVAKRPADAVVLVDRAICLEESGRLNEARAGYEAALAAQPHNAEAHYYYARTLARLRMSTASLAHLTRALTLDSRLAELARGEKAFATFADHPQFRGLVG